VRRRSSDVDAPSCVSGECTCFTVTSLSNCVDDAADEDIERSGLPRNEPPVVAAATPLLLPLLVALLTTFAAFATLAALAALASNGCRLTSDGGTRLLSK
jgi:hypothetical protein